MSTKLDSPKESSNPTMDLMDILNGHGFDIKIVTSPSEIKTTGFYCLASGEAGISHWSEFGASMSKVANEYGLAMDGIQSFHDIEDIDVLLNRMTTWKNWLEKYNVR